VRRPRRQAHANRLARLTHDLESKLVEQQTHEPSNEASSVHNELHPSQKGESRAPHTDRVAAGQGINDPNSADSALGHCSVSPAKRCHAAEHDMHTHVHHGPNPDNAQPAALQPNEHPTLGTLAPATQRSSDRQNLQASTASRVALQRVQRKPDLIQTCRSCRAHRGELLPLCVQVAYNLSSSVGQPESTNHTMNSHSARHGVLSSCEPRVPSVVFADLK
jgi:hypothetical protein